MNSRTLNRTRSTDLAPTPQKMKPPRRNTPQPRRVGAIVAVAAIALLATACGSSESIDSAGETANSVSTQPTSAPDQTTSAAEQPTSTEAQAASSGVGGMEVANAVGVLFGMAYGPCAAEADAVLKENKTLEQGDDVEPMLQLLDDLTVCLEDNDEQNYLSHVEVLRKATIQLGES